MVAVHTTFLEYIAAKEVLFNLFSLKSPNYLILVTVTPKRIPKGPCNKDSLKFFGHRPGVFNHSAQILEVCVYDFIANCFSPLQSC